jgi:hypothetical protein
MWLPPLVAALPRLVTRPSPQCARSRAPRTSTGCGCRSAEDTRARPDTDSAGSRRQRDCLSATRSSLAADMIVRMAKVLDVSTDELLGVVPPAKRPGAQRNLRFVRRLQMIEKLPRRDQDALLRTIDAFLDRAKAG